MASDGRKLFIYGVDQNLQNVELQVRHFTADSALEWFEILNQCFKV